MKLEVVLKISMQLRIWIVVLKSCFQSSMLKFLIKDAYVHDAVVERDILDNG